MSESHNSKLIVIVDNNCTQMCRNQPLLPRLVAFVAEFWKKMVEKSLEGVYVQQKIISLRAEMIEYALGVKQRMAAFYDGLREELRLKSEGPAMLRDLSFEASSADVSFVRRTFETVILFVQVLF